MWILLRRGWSGCQDAWWLTDYCFCSNRNDNGQVIVRLERGGTTQRADDNSSQNQGTTEFARQDCNSPMVSNAILSKMKDGFQNTTQKFRRHLAIIKF